MSATEASAPDASTIDAAALAYAHRFGLVRQDGSIKCAKPLCERSAVLPSLCCQICLQRHQRSGVR